MRKIILLILAAVMLFAACGAYAEDPLHFETFGEAVETGDGPDNRYVISGEGYAAALIERDGRFYRVFAFMDEQEKEYCSTFLSTRLPEDAGFPSDEWLAFTERIMALPVRSVEELTIAPFGQEELDAMAGKTLWEIMSEPWEMGMRHYPEDAETGKDVVFPMVKGFCEYELVVSEPFEVYQECSARDHFEPVTFMSLRNYKDLTVKSVKYTGLSSNMLNPRYLADGTWAGETEEDPVDYDLVAEVAGILEDAWENADPDQEAKEAMIAELTEEHPEAAEIIRRIVESYRR